MPNRRSTVGIGAGGSGAGGSGAGGSGAGGSGAGGSGAGGSGAGGSGAGGVGSSPAIDNCHTANMEMLCPSVGRPPPHSISAWPGGAQHHGPCAPSAGS
ncbi:MAG TPA: hypothetical protein DCL15_03700 [Chloroflexi bacterium]|nr:hypothetical protein [Chloroflexota bacterium]